MNLKDIKTSKKKIVIGLLAVTLIWLLASRAFFSNAFIPTHDGEYHIIRIYEFSKMLKSGFLFPRWAPGLNSGYGVPLFNFHYPFPNYIGSLFYLLGYSLVSSLKLTLAFGYLLALVGCYIVFLKKNSTITAVFATIIFGSVPYWFVDLYIRGSVGEVWGLAWGMIAFVAIVWQIPVLLAISVALLILSHNIMAMLILPILILTIFKSKKTYLLALVLGIGLSAYFWLPAILERGLMNGLNSTTFSDHFPEFFQLVVPSWGSGFSAPGVAPGEMSQQIGIIPSIILVASLFKLIKLFRKKSSHKYDEYKQGLLFATVSCVSILLMLPISIPIWKSLAFLQYIQYPWRLLSLIAISAPFLFVFSIQKKYMQLAIVAVSLIAVYGYTKPVLYEPRDDNYYLSRSNFTDGTSSLGNSFSTIWSPWKQTRSVQKVELISSYAVISNLKLDTMTDSFIVDSTQAALLRVNRLYYPGWSVYLNGVKTNIDYINTGLIEFKVFPGITQVNVKFEGTLIRGLANLLSILTLSGLIIFRIKRKL